MSVPVLDLAEVSRHYGALRAVDRVTMSVDPGARHAVIGPNGAGKSTLFGLVAGTISPTAGVVRFDGDDITGYAEHRRVRRGIAKTFQHSSLFLSMSALDNVMLAEQRRDGRATSLRPSARRDLLRQASAGLERVGLAHRAATVAAQLSHGEQRQLEVGVALACRPRLLLLDEPTAGMSGEESARFAELIEGLPSDITVLLIEHDLEVVFRLATVVTVLHLGQVLAHGSPDDVRGSDEVQEAYLGSAHTEELFIDSDDDHQDDRDDRHEDRDEGGVDVAARRP